MLHRLGRWLFEVVCPEAADRVEGETLAREEERARRAASLSMHGRGLGGPVLHDLADGIPLCPPHHFMADHAASWHRHELPHGGVRFTRRQ